MEPVADLLDRGRGGSTFRDTLRMHRRLLDDPRQTPSAWLMAAMRERRESFPQWMLQQSLLHHAHYLGRKLSPARLEYYEALSRHSLRQQRHLERCSRGLFGAPRREKRAPMFPCVACRPRPCASCKY